jgi:hypothetical protein
VFVGRGLAAGQCVYAIGYWIGLRRLIGTIVGCPVTADALERVH